MAHVIARINEARAAGIDVTSDMYPYDSGGTGMTAMVPPSAEEGQALRAAAEPGRAAADRGRNARAADADVDWANFGNVAGAHNILIAAPEHPDIARYEGWWLSDIALDRGQDWVDAALDLLAIEGHNIFAFYRMMSEENQILQLQQPWMKISTDAGGIDPETAKSLGLRILALTEPTPGCSGISCVISRRFRSKTPCGRCPERSPPDSDCGIVACFDPAWPPTS